MRNDKPIPKSGRSEIELGASGDSVAEAREIARAFLHEHGYTDPGFDALVVVSELTANAIEHGSLGVDRVRLELELRGQTLRVAVTDAARGGSPVALTPDTTREQGRGLYLVDQLTSSWTARIRDGRCEIIAEIPLA